MLPIKIVQPKASRRGFLAASAAAGLLLGFELRTPRLARAAEQWGPFDAYLHIAPDNTVTVLSAHMDMGQGIYTGLATLVADELDADWGQMRVEGAAGNPKLYGNLMWGGAIQGTGGSTAMASSWERYRKAAATARAMLIEAAAVQWNVAVGDIRADRGVLSHPSGQRATFGDLAEAAATLGVPPDVPLKDPASWRLIGDPNLGRLDTPAKTTGTQIFTIDLRLPGMLTAVVAHPPRFGAKVKSFDATGAKAVKGVVDVVEIPRGVAVVAEGMWPAIKGREALLVEWDESAAEKRGTADLLLEYRHLLDAGQGAVARAEGEVGPAIGGAAKVIEASFEFPYLAHAAMEPLNAVALMRDGTLEVWGGHQMPDLYQAMAAEIAGIPPDKVKLHVMMTGGSFGRRATPDADVIVEAVAIGKAIGWKAPVRVQWTREDDMTGGRYRPLYVHKVTAAIDSEGGPTGWRHRIVGQSIMKGSPFEGLIKGGVDATSVEGAANLPYAIPNISVDLVTTDAGVPVLWWRSVGSTHTAYSTEIMIDQLAHAAGKDPVQYRLGLLEQHPRHAGVLKLAAEKAGWGAPLADGKARGVAVHESFNTFVAQVAEISVEEGGGFKVDRVICAVDCGAPVNPDVIKAQMEGGVGFGLGATLRSALTLDQGRVEQTNFDSYEVLRLEEMPVVEVHIVPSMEPPTGVGEPGVPPIGPAVANAYFAATGKLITTLPFTTTLSI